MARRYLLAMDQGTSSSRTALVDSAGTIVASVSREFSQHFPQSGWVEHDAMEIWNTQLATLREVLAGGSVSIDEVAAIGITNQRETIVLWDRKTGRPLCNAIVWQDRRTAQAMEDLRARGHEGQVSMRTGLVLDPYFSASKLAWMLDHVDSARQRAQRGELAAGTIDSWLVWNLTGGRSHVTDVSNASRTMLMNLESLQWDEWMLDLFGIPRELLPKIVDSSGVCAATSAELLGREIPIGGIGGDQQCALFGQACFQSGMFKTTYGTGCFMLKQMGDEPARNCAPLLSTVAWKLAGSKAQYALEGSVFMGGASIQWLRDGLGIIRKASDVNTLAASVPDSGGVVLVPAFTGLGAPHWDASARGTMFGITRATTAAHIARATLDGIAMQVVELHDAMERQSVSAASYAMRCDGGACASDLLMQIQADAMGVAIERPRNLESTALGAAYLAGLAVGVWKSCDEIAALRNVDREFVARTTVQERAALRTRWNRAIERTIGWGAQE